MLLGTVVAATRAPPATMALIFYSPQTLHTICDGSPSCYEDRVKAALELFNRDADKKIRRQAHKVLASVTRTGKWNVL